MLMSQIPDLRIRWRPGERLDHLFEKKCDELVALGKAGHLAAAERGRTYSYLELDREANRLCRHLKSVGVAPGDRVALLLDRSSQVYIALLAIMKAQAAYVPLDASFPDDRLEFILDDSQATAIVSQSSYQERLSKFALRKCFLDSEAKTIAKRPGRRLKNSERGGPADELAYIIYTSGTTGKPKGVAIEHGSICNFVRVAAETYGIEPSDRVFQGMTIAFDFSVEELWVPLMAGATLVPAPAGVNLVGDELAAFLQNEDISVLCCVPTLLATIERDLPKLRILLVSGEACPQHLVRRWYSPNRTILNAYGPTEATVTATITDLHPDKPVTIGKPLPTYSVVILAEEEDALVALGETGEIGIGGIGLAKCYVNRPDLTAEKFIPDFVDLPSNPSRRIYRTGDLGRFTRKGEIEYLGRKDTQVKIRGYRIELTEIESILMRVEGVAQAVVNTFEPEPGTLELVAYYSVKKEGPVPSQETILRSLKAELPPYMVPAYIEKLPIIPMTSSNKADRKSLPSPKTARCLLRSKYVPPRSSKEKLLEAELGKLLNLPAVSIEDDFFKDLGAHSLLMAKYCAALRTHPGFANISIRDVYRNPTIEKLAQFMGDKKPETAERPAKPGPRHIPSALEYYGCGTLQVISMLAFGLFALWILVYGIEWTYSPPVLNLPFYLRIEKFLLALFLLSAGLPILGKWLLIGRWKPGTIRVWSLSYFRFWLVKSLVRTSVMNLFLGSPAYNLFLRLLGARVGSGTVLLSGAPICTDLFSAGDNTIVRNGTMMPGYTAEGNTIYIGGIKLGSDVFAGSASILETGTSMGDGSQLGHSSCLPKGRSIPNGERWHGTPAEKTETNYCRLEGRSCSNFRRWAYTAALFSLAMFVLAPAGIMLVYAIWPYVALTAVLQTHSSLLSALPALALWIAAIASALFAGGLALGLFAVTVIPRLLNRLLTKGEEYPLFGFRYFIRSLVSRFSNAQAFNILFGDSSYITGYLKLIGYKLHKIVQTGANFGLDQVHDNPFCCSIGSGSMVSDGLSMANTEYSSTSFRIDPIEIGEKSYLGNNILYPAGAKTGRNVLLATKVMVPIDGPVREDVGLLGSPSFEIPRAAACDLEGAAMSEASRKEGVRIKNYHNLGTICWYLFANWTFLFSALLTGYIALNAYWQVGLLALWAYALFMLLFSVGYWVLVERASVGFGRLEAKTVGLYDRYFLYHERHWKFCANPLVQAFAGTPLKNLISWLLGVKIGRRIFDDGANIYDKTLIEIGDYANLNAGCVLQGHSLEEGIFKSGHVKIGAACSIASGAFVHYGVDMGESVTLGSNAFLMKGETPPPDTVWEGNPAKLAEEASCIVAAPCTTAAAIERRPKRVGPSSLLASRAM